MCYILDAINNSFYIFLAYLDENFVI